MIFLELPMSSHSQDLLATTYCWVTIFFGRFYIYCCPQRNWTLFYWKPKQLLRVEGNNTFCCQVQIHNDHRYWQEKYRVPFALKGRNKHLNKKEMVLNVNNSENTKY